MYKGNLQRAIRFALFPTLFLFTTMCVPILHAQFLSLPVNLSYLSRRADIIVQGRVVQVSHENLPGYSNIPTVRVSLEVENMLRGPDVSTYTFRETLIGLKAQADKKTYRVGQRILVFLPSPSRYGLSSPVGIEQGRFRIAIDSTGEETITNGIDNAGLFKNMETSTIMAALQPSHSGSPKTKTPESQPVRLDGFIHLVQSLMTLPRIQ
jgi:hypothetical protein